MCSAHDACVEGPGDTNVEVSRAPSGQLTLCAVCPACPFCAKGPRSPSYHAKRPRGPSGQLALYVPKGLGALVINLQHMR